jgi:hypothetical protein
VKVFPPFQTLLRCHIYNEEKHRNADTHQVSLIDNPGDFFVPLIFGSPFNELPGPVNRLTSHNEDRLPEGGLIIKKRGYPFAVPDADRQTPQTDSGNHCPAPGVSGFCGAADMPILARSLSGFADQKKVKK